MTTNTRTEVDDQMRLLSQYYPGTYQQLIPHKEEGVKPRRRWRKSKVEGGNNGTRKRKLSQEQMNLLEQNFADERKLETERKDRLASELGLDPRQVAVWFQNRRARWKSKRLEEEYSKLKAEHDATLVQKFQLETKVLKLGEQLFEAEKEIHKLNERLDGMLSTSLSSSLWMEAMEPPYLGEFGMEGLGKEFYLPENNYISGFEWLNI